MDLLDHPDYRSVLRAWLDGSRRHSQEALARRVGVSRSLVTMILRAERDLALPQARAWAQGLGLPSKDHSTFEAMVRAEHGETLALRRAARQHLSAMREYRTARRPDAQLASLLSRWYVPVLLELTRCEGFRAEVPWISDRLWPEVDPDELQTTLDTLQQAGLLEPGAPLATPRDLDDDALASMGRAYHRQQFEHAALALEALPSEQRHLASLALAVRRTDLPRLVQALHRFHLEVVEPFRVDDPDSVVQLSVQLFPRTRAEPHTPGD